MQEKNYKKIKTSKKDFHPHIKPEKAPPCHAAKCNEAGLYKAPKSRNNSNEYNWFCLEHIREYNQKWDYFSGMDSREIEEFIHDSVTGHRPTWSRESSLRDPHATLQDKLYEFMYNKKPSTKTKPYLPKKIRDALSIMDLSYPCNIKQLKAGYRTLVKKYHPDANKGDKASEEKFKKITAAYKYLLEHVENNNRP